MKYILAALLILPLSLYAGGINDYDGTTAPMELNDSWSANSIDNIELDLSSEDVKITLISGNDITLRYYGDIGGFNIDPEDFLSRKGTIQHTDYQKKTGKTVHEKIQYEC